jgi:hypothetical protein
MDQNLTNMINSKFCNLEKNLNDLHNENVNLKEILENFNNKQNTYFIQ